MRYVIIFLIFTALTIGALVAWNRYGKEMVTRRQTASRPTPTPTPISDPVSLLSAIPTSTPGVTVFGDTKGGISVETKGGVGSVNEPSSLYSPPVSNRAVVSLTESGFSPGVVEIKKGTMVRFVNNSGRHMRVSATDGSGFDMGVSIGTNGTYEYQFMNVGEYSYQNQSFQEHRGKVIVKE